MRRSIAAVATLALLTTTLTGTTPASAEPARSSAAAPFTLGAPPQEYELQMRANGTEQRVLAQAAAEDKKANKPPKGKPATGKGGQGGSAMRTACTFPCYFYTTFYQDFTADPADATSADMMVAKPYVDSALHITAHSLGQAAIESQDGRDIVELGWIVDKNRRADGNPTLFAAHWIDNVFKGYDTAWVDYASNPVNLGAGLPMYDVSMVAR